MRGADRKRLEDHGWIALDGLDGRQVLVKGPDRGKDPLHGPSGIGLSRLSRRGGAFLGQVGREPDQISRLGQGWVLDGSFLEEPLKDPKVLVVSVPRIRGTTVGQEGSVGLPCKKIGRILSRDFIHGPSII
jgi:hypothetical protein